VAPRASSGPAVDRWDDIEISPADDPLPLLPEGEMVDVIVTAARVGRVFDGSWRATLTCDVLRDGERHYTTTSEGESIPMRLPLYFKLPPRKGATGPFQPASRASRFYRLWTVANHGQKPLRRDRMALAIFRDRLFRARTRVVTKNYKGELLPKELQHSVIEDLLP
jgi:hypothetical protein